MKMAVTEAGTVAVATVKTARAEAGRVGVASVAYS